MKCPFCQKELHKDFDGYYTCYTDNCGCWANGGNGASGSESLWLTLINTKELLDIEVAEHSMCHTQMLRTTEKLERTRKALDVAKERLKNTILDAEVLATPEYLASRAKETLAEITALEQNESTFVHNKIEFPEFNDNLLEEFDKQFFEDGQDDDLTETALGQKE